RDRSGVARSLERKSVPYLDFRGATEVRVRTTRAIRSRDQLELRAYQLHDTRRDPEQNRQETAGRAPARKGPYPDGPEKHHRLPDFRDPEPSPARVRLRTPGHAQDPSERSVLRGIIVLELAMGDADRSERDDEHRRHGHDRGEGRHRCAVIEVQL